MEGINPFFVLELLRYEMSRGHVVGVKFTGWNQQSDMSLGHSENNISPGHRLDFRMCMGLDMGLCPSLTICDLCKCTYQRFGDILVCL